MHKHQNASNTIQFLGYDVGDDMVSMVGRHASMHTTDGGVVEAERIVVGQGS